MEEILQILSSLILAGTKYVVGLGFIFYYDFTYVESIIIATAGGMLGVLFFTYGTDLVSHIYYQFFPKKKKNNINWKKRWLVKLRRSVGLKGIAFLTPVVLTVPVGTLVALTVESRKRKIFSHMLVSFLLWSVALSSLFHLTGISFQFG